MTPIQSPTELQLALLQVLWTRGEATVQDVLRDLAGRARQLAQSTVATLLGRLEKKGLVSHRVAGRQYVYRAVVSEPEVRRIMVEELFAGDVATLVSHLLVAGDVSPDDLARVKAMIEAKERELLGKGRAS